MTEREYSRDPKQSTADSRVFVKYYECPACMHRFARKEKTIRYRQSVTITLEVHPGTIIAIQHADDEYRPHVR